MRFPASKEDRTHANCNHSSIFSIIKRHFSHVWDIYDVETLFSLHYACRTWSTRFRTSKHAQKHANRNHSSILSIIKRYFPPVWDISTFKCSFHCIMRAVRSSRDFQRRDEIRRTQIAIILRFFSKLCVISLPFEIFTSFTCSFYFILHAERSLRVF